MLLCLAFASLLLIAYVLGFIHRDDQPFAGRDVMAPDSLNDDGHNATNN